MKFQTAIDFQSSIHLFIIHHSSFIIHHSSFIIHQSINPSIHHSSIHQSINSSIHQFIIPQFIISCFELMDSLPDFSPAVSLPHVPHPELHPVLPDDENRVFIRLKTAYAIAAATVI